MTNRRRRGGGVGGKVRPTTAKQLESLSAILAPRLEGASVLDLFAGTGRVGMRLAERGAERVLFVEGNREVARALGRALREHALSGRFSLVIGVVPRVLARLDGLFDLVVCDPPYDWPEPATLLPTAAHLVPTGGLLVVEHHHKTVYRPVEGWESVRVEKFGETRLSFFQRV